MGLVLRVNHGSQATLSKRVSTSAQLMSPRCRQRQEGSPGEEGVLLPPAHYGPKSPGERHGVDSSSRLVTHCSVTGVFYCRQP